MHRSIIHITQRRRCLNTRYFHTTIARHQQQQQQEQEQKHEHQDENDPEGKPFAPWLMNTYVGIAGVTLSIFLYGTIKSFFTADKTQVEERQQAREQLQAVRRAAVLEQEEEQLANDLKEGRDTILDKYVLNNNTQKK
jgi:hypothetical protein